MDVRRIVRAAGLVVFLFWLVAASSFVQAAPIIFGTAQNVSSPGDVTLGGQTTLDRAYDFGAGNLTINGIAFTDFNAQNGDTVSGLGSQFGGYGTDGQSGDYGSLLTNGNYQDAGSAVFTFNNLQVGDTYSIGVWVNDDRGGFNRVLTVTGDDGSTPGSLTFGGASPVAPGQFVYGTFTATTSSQTLNLDAVGNNTGNNQINGVLLAYSSSVVVNSLTWNGGGGVTSPADGGGTWINDGSTANWWSNATSGSTTWSDSSAAVFGAGSGTAGTVTISGAVQPSSLSFQPTGDGSTYTLTGGSIDLNGATRTISTAVNATIASTLIDSTQTFGGVNKTGTGTLTLTNANNSFPGPVTFAGGTIAVASIADSGTNSPLGAGAGLAFTGGALEYTGTDSSPATDRSVSLGYSGGTIQVDNATTDLTFNGAVTGGGTLTKNGPGMLTLAAANSYGGATINGGTLQLATNDYGPHQYSGGPISINNGSTLQVVASVGGAQYWFNGTSFVFDGNGGGTIDDTTNVNFVLNNGDTFRTNGSARDTIIGASGINLNGPTATFNVARGTDPTSDLYVSSYLWNNGSILKTGNGILTLAGPNTYTGNTTVSAGTLQVANASALGSINNGLNVSGGVVDLAGYNVGVGQLSGGGVIDISTGTSTLTVGNGNVSSTFSGTIQNTSGLIGFTKTGADALTLTAAQAYSGPTAISGGTLQLRAPQVLLADNLMSNTINTAKWTPNSTANGNSQVNPTTSGVQLVSRGYLNTTAQYDPTQLGGLNITGNWQFTGDGGDLLQIDTRSSGTPDNSYGEVTNGVEFNYPDTGSSTPEIQGRGSFTIGNLVTSGDLNVHTGDILSFDATDGGLNNLLSFTVTDVTDNTSGTATATLSGGTATANYVTFHNREDENSNFASLLSNVVISSLSATGTGNVLPANSSVTISNGATLDMTNGTQTISSLSSTDGQGSVVSLGSGALTVGDSTSTTFDGTIAGLGGSLIKQGDGTLVLSGTNSYTGGTNVEAGTLVLSSPAALEDGSSLTVGADAAALFAASSAGEPHASVAISPVPEPDTLALLAGTLVAGFGVWRKRRRVKG